MKYSRIALTFALAGMACLLNAVVLTAGGSSPADEDFVRKAAAAGTKAVIFGRLAATNAQSATVKAIGRRMVTDQTSAGIKLKVLATKKGIVLPADLDSDSQAALDRLTALKGAEFDRAYMELMVADHDITVANYEAEADSGTDADLKAFALKTLPNLQSHLQIAQDTNAKLK